MGINGDDIGKHPTHDPDTITDALACWDQAAVSAHVPVQFLEALHDAGAAGRVYLSIPTSDGQVQVAINDPPHPVNPARDAEIWAALRHVICTLRAPAAESSSNDPIPHAGVPPELALISWERDGTRLYACPPEVSSDTSTPRGSNPGP